MKTLFCYLIIFISSFSLFKYLDDDDRKINKMIISGQKYWYRKFGFMI